MISEYLLILSVLVSVLGSLFPALLDSPAKLLLDFFFLPDAFSVAIAFLTLFFFAREVEQKAGPLRLAVLYFAGVAVSMAVSPGKTPAWGGLDAVLGALVALDPWQSMFVEFYPIPVVAAAGFFIVSKLVLTSSFEIASLLVGIAYGYLVLGTTQAERKWAPARK